MSYDWMNLRANPKLENMNGWQDRHNAAIEHPTARETIVAMLRGWAIYAAAHYQRYGSFIGDDGVLGPAWINAGEAMRDLLNGDCGRLDCGTLDAYISNTITANHGEVPA